MDYPQVVEAKDVRFLERQEYERAGRPVLKLTGLVFHSALAVEGVDLGKAGDAVLVTARLTPAKEGLSGRFSLEVPLPTPTGRVLFGPAQVQIWPANP